MDQMEAFYDGSSTESEPFGDDELPAAPPARASAAVHASEPVDEALGAAEASAPAPTVSPPLPSHNVLDLLELIPPTLPFASAAVAGVEEPSSSRQMQASASASAPASASAGAATCVRCHKHTLHEVASLTPRLASYETLFCHCCGLTLPWFCFTSPQRSVRRSECRGCHGVPAVVAALTQRVRNLVPQWKPTYPPLKVSRSARQKSKLAGAVTSVAGTSSQPPSSGAVETAGATARRALPIDLVRRGPLCSLCGQSLAPMTEAQASDPEGLPCFCCKRQAPSVFFSKNQWSKARKDRSGRCKGCLKQLGNAETDTMEWQKVTEVGEKDKQKEKRAEWKRRKKLARAEKQRREQQERDERKRLHKLEATEKNRAALEKWRREKERIETERTRREKQLQEEGEVQVFRSKVEWHRLALCALRRKRHDNDLRGVTRVEYLKQLAKEEASLMQVSRTLRALNPAVYAEIMDEKVQPSNIPESRRDKRPYSRHAGDPNYESDDQGAASAAKKAKISGLAVTTRSQRQALEVKAPRSEPGVIDLTGE